jgi:hypothetical protein
MPVLGIGTLRLSLATHWSVEHALEIGATR